MYIYICIYIYLSVYTMRSSIHLIHLSFRPKLAGLQLLSAIVRPRFPSARSRRWKRRPRSPEPKETPTRTRLSCCKGALKNDHNSETLPFGLYLYHIYIYVHNTVVEFEFLSRVQEHEGEQERDLSWQMHGRVFGFWLVFFV